MTTPLKKRIMERMVCMFSNFRLVPKFTGNTVEIYFVIPNGDGHLVAKIYFPNDNQQLDNMHCVEEVCASIKKRIRKSV